MLRQQQRISREEREKHYLNFDDASLKICLERVTRSTNLDFLSKKKKYTFFKFQWRYIINKREKKSGLELNIAGFLPADLMNEMSALLVKQSKKGREFLNSRYGMDHQTENRFCFMLIFFNGSFLVKKTKQQQVSHKNVLSACH